MTIIKTKDTLMKLLTGIVVGGLLIFAMPSPSSQAGFLSEPEKSVNALMKEEQKLRLENKELRSKVGRYLDIMSVKYDNNGVVEARRLIKEVGGWDNTDGRTGRRN